MFTMPACFNAGDTIYFPFDTYDSNGASVTITGLAVTDIEVFKNGSTTQRASDNGYTLLDTDGIDFDSTTGLHGFSIDTSDNSDSGFWTDGSQYWVNVNAITVDSQTVRFTYFLPLGYSLRPTTAGRKLDVSSTGEAGIDWANIGSPTTTVNLSGTTVKTATDVEIDTQDIQGRLPAALTGAGNIKADSLAISGSSDAADNLETKYDTDFATNYDATNKRSIVQARKYYDRGDSSWHDYPENLYLTAIDSNGSLILTSDYDPAKTAAQAGDAMALTSGERSTLAGVIWNSLTSGMSTAGSIGKKLADWTVGQVTTLSQAALALFATADTGETTASTGSVAKIAQGAADADAIITGTTDAVVAALAQRTIAPQSSFVNTTLTIEGGHKYSSTTKPLTISKATGETWPDGDDYDVPVLVTRIGDVTTIYTLTWTTTNGANAQIDVPLTAVQTQAMADSFVEGATYSIYAYKTSDGNDIGLIRRGKLNVVDNPNVGDA